MIEVEKWVAVKNLRQFIVVQKLFLFSFFMFLERLNFYSEKGSEIKFLQKENTQKQVLLFF